MANETTVRSFRDYDGYSRQEPSLEVGRRAPAGEDPLAELARIISRDDPYAAFLRSGAVGERPVSAPVQAQTSETEEPEIEIPAMSLASAQPEAARSGYDWDDLEAELESFVKARGQAAEIGPLTDDEAESEADVGQPQALDDPYSDAGEMPAEDDYALRASFAGRDEDEMIAAAHDDGLDPAAYAAMDHGEQSDATGAEPDLERRFEEALAQDRRDNGQGLGLGTAAIAGAGAVAAGAAVASWRLRGREPAAAPASVPAAERASTDPIYSADGHMPAHSNLEPEVAPPRRRRAGMTAVMTVIGVAVLGGGGVLAYRGLTGGTVSGEPRVVRANPEPVRVAVQQAQEQKPVNDRVPGGDRVVSREERPLSQREQQAQIPPVATPRVIPLSVPAAAPDTRAATTPAPVGEAPTQSGLPQARPANADEPRRVRTVTVGADGQIAGQPRSAVGGLPLSVTPSATTVVPMAPSPAAQSVVPQATPVAVPAPRPPAPPVASQQAAATPAATPVRNQPAAPRPASGEQPLDIAPARTASVRPAPAATPASGGGSSFVQISSHQSEAEARTALGAAQRRYSVLQGQPTNVTSVNLGDRGTWHRARLGPMPRSEAQSLCERLKGAGGSCVVN